MWNYYGSFFGDIAWAISCGLTTVALFLLAASIALGFAARCFRCRMDNYVNNKRSYKEMIRWREFWLKYADKIKHRKKGTAQQEIDEIDGISRFTMTTVCEPEGSNEASDKWLKDSGWTAEKKADEVDK